MRFSNLHTVLGDQRQRRARLGAVVALAAGLVLFQAPTAHAERCLSKSLYADNTVVGANAFARKEGAAPSSPFFAYGAANCAGSTVWMGGGPKPSLFPFGPTSLQPTFCFRVLTGSTFSFKARWPSAAARTAAGSAAGCSFKCGSKTCQVNGENALPVELLTFGID